MERALSTIKQQRSFTADWLIGGDPTGLPQGVIVDLSIVTSSASPVYLGRLAITDGTLTISLEQNGGICAYGSISGDSRTQGLQVLGSVISVTITTGSLAGLDGVLYYPTRAQISPDLVTVIGNMDEGVTTLTIVQDGQEVAYTLTEDTELAVSDNLELLYDDSTGEAIISMSDDNYSSFVQIVYPIIYSPSTLVSINNIKSSTGVLAITIETDGRVLPTYTTDNGVVTIDGSDIVLCGDREDMIDSKISPSLHVSGYKPLDDMYTDGAVPGEYVRDTLKVVGEEYGTLGGNTLTITEKDPQVDCEYGSL